MSREQVEMIAEMARALRSARRIIQQDRDDQFEASCVPGQPETFDEADRPWIDRYDRVLRKIDRALT